MKITREALKRIVIQEMTRMEENTLNIDGVEEEEYGNAPSNKGGMKEITEAEGEISEGIENITPENIAIIVQALGMIVGNLSPALLIGILGKTAYDAIKAATGEMPPKPPASRDDY
tara:strand:+ start:209 stop:556 length:348 start_codon:yes stop_codon:yes gene_type:complete